MGRNDLEECRKQISYLEALSQREKLKFEGIQETSRQQNETSSGDTLSELLN